jgi:predicted peroxiredoxin
MGALDAGHQPEIFLAGEAAYLMKDSVLGAVQPVAMPALKDMLDELVAKRCRFTSEGAARWPVGSPKRT